MGLFDKVKNILFDEEPDEEVEALPKRQPKKKAKTGLSDYTEEIDTIKEVKIEKEEKEDKFDFPIDDYESISRTRLRENDYDTPVEREIPTEPIRVVRPEPTPTPVVERHEPVQHVDRSRYELPPKKEVVHESRDYKKILSETTANREKKPFTVTPIISPVYGILDKNYKPEQIPEKNKSEKYDQVRERMFGPVSYADEDIPEPIKYEEKKESLTEKLIKENKAKEEKIEETVSKGIENEFETTSEFDTIPEMKQAPKEEKRYIDEDPTSPSVDISDLIEEAESHNYDDEVEEEVAPREDYYKTESPEDFEPEEEVSYSPEPRKEEVKESLDDTIETDLFNLIDSMYNTDEKE